MKSMASFYEDPEPMTVSVLHLTYSLKGDLEALF